jgi:hypothetical protein
MYNVSYIGERHTVNGERKNTVPRHCEAGGRSNLLSAGLLPASLRSQFAMTFSGDTLLPTAIAHCHRSPLTVGTVTPDGDLVIEGEKIKIAPVNEEGLGLFFVASDESETPVTHPLTQNDPKKIVCRVPAALPADTYTLKIVTRYSNGTTMLKEPRTIVYGQALTVA